ncbi:MAG: hypothetical protein JW940_01265 [Polyangiaceae bacterium]|nr:hypothetical protein [Polyangiaceae bacterium]
MPACHDKREPGAALRAITGRVGSGSRGGAFALVVLLTACGGAARPGAGARAEAAPQNELSRYFPLTDNTVYTYQTRNEETGESGLLMLEISRPRTELAELRVAGRVRRLEIRGDAIRYANGGAVLARPIRKGSRWFGQDGPVEVTAVNVTAKVPAGRYIGCIETQESGGHPEAGRRTTTVYCPNVGIVKLAIEASSQGELVTEVAELMAFGPRVDLGLRPR